MPAGSVEVSDAVFALVGNADPLQVLANHDVGLSLAQCRSQESRLSRLHFDRARWMRSIGRQIRVVLEQFRGCCPGVTIEFGILFFVNPVRACFNRFPIMDLWRFCPIRRQLLSLLEIMYNI